MNIQRIGNCGESDELKRAFEGGVVMIYVVFACALAAGFIAQLTIQLPEAEWRVAFLALLFWGGVAIVRAQILWRRHKGSHPGEFRAALLGAMLVGGALGLLAAVILGRASSG
jgi:hypothetical protein